MQILSLSEIFYRIRDFWGISHSNLHNIWQKILCFMFYIHDFLFRQRSFADLKFLVLKLIKIQRNFIHNLLLNPEIILSKYLLPLSDCLAWQCVCTVLLANRNAASTYIASCDVYDVHLGLPLLQNYSYSQAPWCKEFFL